MKNEPSAGALKAARNLSTFSQGWDTENDEHISDIAHLIDEETGLKELIEAAEKMDRLYGNLFDTTDGGGWVMPDALPKYDAAFEILRKALAKAKGE